MYLSTAWRQSTGSLSYRSANNSNILQDPKCFFAAVEFPILSSPKSTKWEKDQIRSGDPTLGVVSFGGRMRAGNKCTNAILSYGNIRTRSPYEPTQFDDDFCNLSNGPEPALSAQCALVRKSAKFETD